MGRRAIRAVQCNEDHVLEESTVGWFMGIASEVFGGTVKGMTMMLVGVESGQFLTIQVDTDASNLKFWMDGKPYGPGYTSGVTGPLRWATCVCVAYRHCCRDFYSSCIFSYMSDPKKLIGYIFGMVGWYSNHQHKYFAEVGVLVSGVIFGRFSFENLLSAAKIQTQKKLGNLEW